MTTTTINGITVELGAEQRLTQLYTEVTVTGSGITGALLVACGPTKDDIRFANIDLTRGPALTVDGVEYNVEFSWNLDLARGWALGNGGRLASAAVNRRIRAALAAIRDAVATEERLLADRLYRAEAAVADRAQLLAQAQARADALRAELDALRSTDPTKG